MGLESLSLVSIHKEHKKTQKKTRYNNCNRKLNNVMNGFNDLQVCAYSRENVAKVFHYLLIITFFLAPNFVEMSNTGIAQTLRIT